MPARPSPFGELWIDLAGPVLDLSVMPATGFVSFSTMLPPLSLCMLLVLQPMSLTGSTVVMARRDSC